MSAEALRSVFAEFGFDVDDAPLEKMLADTERAIKLEEDLSKAEKKVLADVRKAHEEKAKAAQKQVEDSEKTAAAERKALEDLVPGLRAVTQIAGSARLKLLGIGAALIAVAVSAHRFAVAFAEDVSALREASDAARVTEQQFQQLTLAGVSAGVSASTTAGAMNTLAEGLRAIEARTGGPTNALWRLGVRARNVDGSMRDTNAVLEDLADRFERVRNPIHRARLAQELFGSNGRRMLQVLAGGSAALRRQREDFAALGGGVLPEAVEQGRRFTVAQHRMGIALDSVRSVIATSLLPVMTWLTNKAADVTGWWSRMTRGTNALNVAMAAFGVVAVAAGAKFLIAFGPIIAPVIAAGLALAVVLVVVEDIVTFLQGGNSVIAEFIDYLYGAGEARETLQYLPTLWRDIAEWIDRATEKVVGFLQRLGLVRGEVAAVGRLRPVSERGIGAATQTVPARGNRPARRITVTPTGATVERRPGEAQERIAGTGDFYTPQQPGLGVRRDRRPPRLRPAPATVEPAPMPPWAQPGGGGHFYAPRAPGGGGARQVTNHTSNQFHITGVSDPRAAAELAMRMLAERERQRADASHPQDAEE